MRVFEDTLVINYSEASLPPQIYIVRMKEVLAEGQTLDQLLDVSNLEVNKLEELSIASAGDEFGQFYHDTVRGIKQDIFTLDNGAEAMFLRSGDLASDKKHPMLLLIHGGPFAASPYQMFLAGRQLLLMQGFCLLIVNFRGSIGYGEDSLNSLLGKIGENDVSDCGNLTKKALELFPDIIDPEKLGVFGGSHGGFLTGHMIGHPDYRDMWKAASLWNPVLDMTYMINSTDIPDWIFACCGNEELDLSTMTAEQKVNFFTRSPMAHVRNVITPAQFLIGDADLRVPPHQAYYYQAALKSRGVETRLFNYPGSGHGLVAVEHSMDATFNISQWMDKFLIAPFEPPFEEVSDDQISLEQESQ